MYPVNPPAFPTNADTDADGMTLRDWFAGQALASMLQLRGTPEGERERCDLTEDAYRIADAMLEQREA